MRLSAPTKPPVNVFEDINGNAVQFPQEDRTTLLAFFRDVNCPFCNFRIYELTQQYDELSAMGLDVIAIFSEEEDVVRRFAEKRKRPFPIVADPDSDLYAAYGIEEEPVSKMAMMFKYFTKMVRGMMLTGPKAMTSNSEILPADFVISDKGYITETHYGEDYDDRLPIEAIYKHLNV